MREALNKALRDNPNSPLAGDIVSANNERHKEARNERHKRDLGRLESRFQRVGFSYHYTESFMSFAHRRLNPEELKQEWQQLQTSLAGVSEAERPQMISALADGMRLGEGDVTSGYLRKMLAMDMLNNPLGSVKELFTGIKFNTASKAFFVALSNISGYSREQRSQFEEFMYGRKELSRTPTLSEVLPAVAEWLVQSRNNTQSSRLS